MYTKKEKLETIRHKEYVGSSRSDLKVFLRKVKLLAKQGFTDLTIVQSPYFHKAEGSIWALKGKAVDGPVLEKKAKSLYKQLLEDEVSQFFSSRKCDQFRQTADSLISKKFAVLN